MIVYRFSAMYGLALRTSSGSPDRSTKMLLAPTLRNWDLSGSDDEIYFPMNRITVSDSYRGENFLTLDM